MNLSRASSRKLVREGEGTRLTKSVRDVTRQLADERIFQGREVETEHHYATRGFEWLPETLTLPGQLPCDEWDKALMPPVIPEPPVPVYVTTDLFWHVIEVVGLGYASLLGMVLSLFRKTSRLESLPAQMAKMEENIVRGQQGLKVDVEVVRKTLTDVMLQRGRGADVDRYEPRRRNGDE